LEFNVAFQHKYGYIRDERSEVESYTHLVKEGQQYINLNPDRLFVQQSQYVILCMQPSRHLTSHPDQLNRSVGGLQYCTNCQQHRFPTILVPCTLFIIRQNVTSPIARLSDSTNNTG